MSFGYSNTLRGSDRAKRNAKAFGHYNPVDEIIAPRCPDCGAPMIRHRGTSRSTGKQFDFFGCSMFSVGCKKTLPLSAGKKSGGEQ